MIPFALFGAGGIVHAVKISWLTDDAFISFRYAKNLVDGLGLVYNSGEYVEGFTNFLWTMMIALAMKIGIAPEGISQVFGIIFFTGTIFVLFRFSALLNSNSKLLPIAAAAFAVNHHAAVFATSGLESSMFVFFVVTGFYFLYRDSQLKDQFFALSLFSLSAMTRPDGLLFYAIASLILFSRDWRLYIKSKIYFIKLHSFMLFVFIPYWIWRMTYYGWLLPNTFYAKSGSELYLEQGLNYFLMYFSAYYVFAIVPLFAAIDLFRRKNINSRIYIYLLLPAILYGGYYTFIGGDFMFGRFYMPVIPFFLLYTDYNINRISTYRFRYALSLFIPVLTILYANPYRGALLPFVKGIANENEIYKTADRILLTEKLKKWKNVFRENEFRIAIRGAQAIFGYYLETPYVLEASGGLTDEYLAHRKVEKRGHVGHEKVADLEYLKKRKINILMNGLNFPYDNEYNVIRIKSLPGHGLIIFYEKEKMDRLAEIEDFEFINFDKYLNQYIQNMATYPLEKIKKDFDGFNDYYFNHNNDARVEIFRKKLGIK